MNWNSRNLMTKTQRMNWTNLNLRKTRTKTNLTQNWKMIQNLKMKILTMNLRTLNWKMIQNLNYWIPNYWNWNLILNLRILMKKRKKPKNLTTRQKTN